MCPGFSLEGFGSEATLAAETCARGLNSEGWAERVAVTRGPSFGAVVRGYLSRRHRDDPGHGCPFRCTGIGCRASTAIGLSRRHGRAPGSAAWPSGFSRARCFRALSSLLPMSAIDESDTADDTSGSTNRGVAH
jgi:hypothetical protein